MPSNNDDENPYVFDAKQSLPRRQGQDQRDWEGSIVEDIKEEAADAVLDKAGGCLLHPVVWLVTLPFRVIWRVIEGMFE